jgi:NSS family neurotransmitter:Na+ symporter
MSSRGSFSGRFGFIMAAAGSAVGLGNIWRFPYLAGQNGGAPFLLIYLAFVLLLCFPVLVGEIAIGRKAGTDAYGSYRKLGGRHWGLLGLFGIFGGALILSFYNVVAGWAFGYFLEIVFGGLLQREDFGKFFGDYVRDVSDNFWFSLGFMVITAFIVTRGIQKGIEMANKIMMPLLYLILLGLIVYGITLPNAVAGIRFYLVPEFREVNMQTVFDALRQAFFSLSLGMGALITYGSYLKKDQDIVSSAAIISVADTMVAFFAGLMIFPLVFSAGMQPTEGPPLVFVILPKIFRDMHPVVGRIVGGSFFLMLCFAALTSTISMLEVPTAFLVDQKKYGRKKVVWVLASLIFVMGLPSMMSQGAPGYPWLNRLGFYQGKDFMTFVSDMADIFLTVGGCLMCIFISRRWKMHNMHEELAQGNSGYPHSLIKGYMHIAIKYLCPVVLGVLSMLIILDKFLGLGDIF